MAQKWPQKITQTSKTLLNRDPVRRAAAAMILTAAAAFAGNCSLFFVWSKMDDDMMMATGEVSEGKVVSVLTIQDTALCVVCYGTMTCSGRSGRRLSIWHRILAP